MFVSSKSKLQSFITFALLQASTLASVRSVMSAPLINSLPLIFQHYISDTVSSVLIIEHFALFQQVCIDHEGANSFASNLSKLTRADKRVMILSEVNILVQ